MEKFCQSCGMSINNNLQRGILITDFNNSNCSCNQEQGQLTKSGKLSRKIKSLSIEKMKVEGMPKFWKWLSSRGDSSLE